MARAPGYRLFRAVPIVVAAIAVLYVVVANVVLRTRVLRDAFSRDPDALLVDYDSAWSLVPGRARVHGLRIRGKDSSVEWQLTIDDADLYVALMPLVARRFHVQAVRARGETFRLRRRLDAHAATRDAVARLPPIDGLEARPIKPPPPPPPTPDQLARYWTIAIDGIDARAWREIWIDDYRLGGAMHLTGSFVLRPMQRVQVGASTADIEDAELSLGPRELIARPLTAHVAAAVDPFDPREVHGAAILRAVSAHVRADGAVKSIAPLRGSRAHVDIGFDRGSVGDARVSLRDVSVDSRDGPSARAWWGDFVLRNATLATSRSPSLRATIDAHMRDGRPILALLADNAALPAWASKVSSLDELHVAAIGAVGSGEIELRDLEATGGGFVIRASLLERGDRKLGVAIVRHGALALGLEIVDDRVSLVTDKPVEWFEARERHPAPIKRATRAR